MSATARTIVMKRCSSANRRIRPIMCVSVSLQLCGAVDNYAISRLDAAADGDSFLILPGNSHRHFFEFAVGPFHKDRIPVLLLEERAARNHGKLRNVLDVTDGCEHLR